jgi:hypothetical protein
MANNVSKRLDNLAAELARTDPEPLRIYYQISDSDPARYTLTLGGVEQPGEYTREDIDALPAGASVIIVTYTDMRGDL